MKPSLFLKVNSPDRETTDGKVALRDSGDKARAKGDWAEAASYYSSYLSVDPHDFDIWVQLGHAYKETGTFSKARAAYEEAIKLKPNDFDLFLNMGHLMKLAERPYGRDCCLHKILRIKPFDTVTLFKSL